MNNFCARITTRGVAARSEYAKLHFTAIEKSIIHLQAAHTSANLIERDSSQKISVLRSTMSRTQSFGAFLFFFSPAAIHCDGKGGAESITLD